MTVTIAFIYENYKLAVLLILQIKARVCGANGDLFGRRRFIIFGNVLLLIGFIVRGSAKNKKAIIAACALIGFVSDCSLKISAVLTVP